MTYIFLFTAWTTIWEHSAAKWRISGLWTRKAMRTAEALPPCLFHLPFPSSAKRERKRGANYVGHLGMTLHKSGSTFSVDWWMATESCFRELRTALRVSTKMQFDAFLCVLQCVIKWLHCEGEGHFHWRPDINKFVVSYSMLDDIAVFITTDTLTELNLFFLN